MLALSGLLSLIGISNTDAVSIGGCDNYVPLDGDVVVCTPTVSPVAGQGVIAPANNTTNNNISVTIQAGTFLDINGSTIGLGSGSTVINDGRLNTQRFTNGYGISAGVNGRSQLGGNSITNNGDITTAGSNAHGIFISAAAITNGANNTIINTGLIQTSGTGDGIRLFTTARGVTNQISNSGSIITAAKVAGIRLRSTESFDTISNTGIITMSGVDAVGILVLNTLNRPTVSNTGTITTTGPEGHAIYGEGAMTLINSGTLTSDVYAIYFQTGTRSVGSNSVTLKAGSNITGGLRFNPSKTSETLVFDGFVDANFDNNLLNVNNISAIQSADVTMNAASYSFGASEINVDQTSQLTISAPIGDAAIATSMTKLGAGVLTLSGQSTYTGTTTINAGILRVGAPNALPTNTAVIISGGTLALNNINATIGSLAGTGAVTLGTASITTGGNGSDTTYGGVNSGAGGLIKNGAGTFTLSGQNTYTGSNQVVAGTLATLGDNRLNASLDVSVASGATFLLGGAQTAAAISALGTIDLSEYRLTTGATSSTITGTIVGGAGGITHDGPGTLTLAGTTDFLGNLIINAGTVDLANSGSVRTDKIIELNAGGTLIVEQRTIIGVLRQNGGTLSGGGELVASLIETESGSLNAIITDSSEFKRGISKITDGVTTIGAPNTFTGILKIEGGRLQLAPSSEAYPQGGSFAPETSVLLSGSGTLDLNGKSQTFSFISGTSGTVHLGGGQLIIDGTQNSTYSGVITGAGGLVKDGSSVLTLAGKNTYSGDTTIEAGVLKAGSDDVIAQTGLTIKSGGTFELNNFDQTLAGLTGSGTVSLGEGELTINGPGNSSFAGIITGEGSLIKRGPGNFELIGDNTFSGGTTISEGTLSLVGAVDSGVLIETGAQLSGSGTVFGDVVNQGVIEPQINGESSTLTIIGSYTGENGTFASTLESTTSNTILADQLAIVGAGSTASGSTTIAISDPSGVLGQPTTGDGILLVGFSDGATGTNTAFRSDRIAAGAYEYELVRGNQSSDQDWYLRADNNAPAPPQPITPQTAQRQEVALYPVLPTLVRQYLMSITGTLDERRGAPDSLPKERVAWARVIAQHNETSPPNVNDGPGLKANDWGLQIGADFVRADLDAGHWRMGPVLTIGRSTGQAYNSSGSFNTGSVSLDGYSLGLNATLAMDNGSYLDVLVLGTRLTGVSANSPLGTSIQTTGWGLSGSVEGGWRLGFSDTVSLTPQVQFYGVHTQLADSGDLFSRIEMPNASMFVGRVGLKIAYDNASLQGPKTQLWARVSALTTLSGRDASTSFLNVAGTNPTVFQSQAPATWMSLDAGVTVNATPNTQINIGLGYQTSFNGQFTGVSGQINARIGF